MRGVISGQGGIDYSDLYDEIYSKVEKVEGKGLSTNDYTDADKAFLNRFSTDENGGLLFDGKSLGGDGDKPITVLQTIKEHKIYQEEEHIVGAWINGKPLYEKIMRGSAPAVETLYKIDDNVDFVLIENSLCTRDDGGWAGCISCTEGNSNMTAQIRLDILNKQLRCYCSDSQRRDSGEYHGSWIAIVRYTKTTDAENSYKPIKDLTDADIEAAINEDVEVL